jgi:hypothetical protein
VNQQHAGEADIVAQAGKEALRFEHHEQDHLANFM